MKTRAAVAFEAGQPLEITELDLAGPQAGDVLVEIKATGICHTDEFTLSGADPEGLFPAVLAGAGGAVYDAQGQLHRYGKSGWRNGPFIACAGFTVF